MERLLFLILSSASLLVAFPSDWSVCTVFGGTCQERCLDVNRGPKYFGFNYPVCADNLYCCRDTSTCYNDQQCGEYNVLPTARLGFSDGDDARGSAPWQVSMRRIRGAGTSDPLANSDHLGAAVLFHREWIVTDCTVLLNIGRQTENETITGKLLLVLGEYDLLVREIYQGRAQEQLRTAQKIIYQAGYRFQSGETFWDVLEKAGANLPVLYQANSICLIKLSAPVQITDWVKPICLPEPDVCVNNIDCRITAWGLDENQQLERRLQVTRVNQFNKEACEAIDYFRTGTYSILPQTTKCALNDKSSFSCVGDYGGPLACNNPKNDLRATLQGIMTYTLPCAKDFIRISDVPAVVDWMWDTCFKNE